MQGLLFIIFLIIIVLLKQLLGIFNSRIYVKEFKQIKNEYTNGYFGLGIYQPKFGIGQVCLIVIDEGNIILECKVIHGLTIFSKFHRVDELIGHATNDVQVKNSKYAKALKSAIGNAHKAKRRTALTA